MIQSVFLFCLVNILGISCFQPPVHVDHNWEHFSPSLQISQSNFHPVNFNDASGTYHQHQRSLSNQVYNQEPIRRQFDAPNDDTFSKLSNPFEYQQPVGEQHPQQQQQQQRHQEQQVSKLSNPFEFQRQLSG